MLRIFFDGLSPRLTSPDCVSGGAAKPRLVRLVTVIGMEGCLACDLAEGRVPLPGGVIHETPCWFVEHTVGPLNLGTLIMKPKRHVTRVSELTEDEASESGPLLRRAAAVVDELAGPDQVYTVSGRTR